MDISSVNSDLIRGNVTTIILGSLWNRDRYGYDILKEIELKSEGQYKLKQPTLYNQLKRLEKQGLISSYEGDPDDTGGGRRRYYSLTAEGRSFLEKERSEYEYSRTILDKLVSSRQFDFDTTPAPFNTDDLRPYTKKDNSDKAKVVYKEKEKVVVVERKVYIDADGNEISEEEAQRLAAEGGSRAVSEEEYQRIQEEKQAEIDRIAAEKQAEIDRLEEEKRQAEEKFNAEMEAELKRAEEEKIAELERAENERVEALERLRAEKEEELRRIEEEKLVELERVEAQKQAEIAIAEEERRLELERLADEAREERERLEAEHAEEVERLKAEKLAAEEEYAAKEAEAEARHEEELERLRKEKEDAEERFREEYALFEEEKRAEEERRAETERIETERREELERIEREREDAEKRFAEEREKFLAEKAEEEAKREAFEQAERERREKAEREAREREEALRSQATMSLDDVFKELDSRSEYTSSESDDDRLIVSDAEWHVETPLPEAEEEKTEEEIPAEVAEEEVPADIDDEEEKDASTASLEEIFRTLDAKSEYAEDEEEKEEYIVDDAEWHAPASVKEREEEVAPAAETEEEEETEAYDDAPVELTEEEEALAEEAMREEEDGSERDALLAELARREAERKAELERIARELEEMRAKLDSPTYVYAEKPAAETVTERTYESEESVSEEEEYTPSPVPGRKPESTLSEVFRRIDERDAAKKEPSDIGSAAADRTDTADIRDEDKGEFVTSAVASERTEAFDYEKSDVDYRGFFSSLATAKEEAPAPAEPERALPRPEPDLKSRLYSEGFKMRSYDRRNTSEYYTFNFINANRLNRDCWLIVMAIFLVEAAVMWACTARDISYVYFLPIMAGGAALTLIPTIIWLINPTRRKRADFNVKLSVLNRGMMLIELAVVLVLIAFFGVGVSVKDTVLILETMVLPIILLTNLPLSSLIYYGLYRSKRYHTA